jgi:hypothetical protein
MTRSSSTSPPAGQLRDRTDAVDNIPAAGVYHVTVSVNGVKVDEKTQSYPPHGTIGIRNNTGGLPTRGTFSITGMFSPPNDDPQEFYLKCVLA